MYMCIFICIYVYIHSFIHSVSSVTLGSPDKYKHSNPTPLTLGRFCIWPYNSCVFPSVCFLPSPPSLSRMLVTQAHFHPHHTQSGTVGQKPDI